MMQGNYSTHGYATRNHTALCAPLPKLTIRPAHTVLGWTADQKAAWALQIARRDVEAMTDRLAAACAALGAANRVKGAMRRHWQGQAFRQINAARRQLRAARAALVVAEAA